MPLPTKTLANLKLIPFTDEVWRTLNINRYLTKSRDSTTAEQYYVQLAAGQLGLVLSTQHDQDFAFVQVTPDNSLWISAAYATLGDAFSAYIEDFKTLARTLNCVSISWSSRRVGYLRKNKYLSSIGQYEIDNITYRISI